MDERTGYISEALKALATALVTKGRLREMALRTAITNAQAALDALA
jgi:hypothetical protein